MRTVRILGMLFAIGTVVGGCLEVFLYDADEVNTWAENYSIFKILILSFAIAAFLFAGLSLLFNNRVFLGLSLIPVAGNVAVGLVYILQYYYSIAEAYLEFISIGTAFVTFIFMMVALFSKRAPRVKTAKSSKALDSLAQLQGDQEQSQDNYQQPMQQNYQMADQNMLSQGQDVSGNTISERERISRLREELNGLDFSKIAEADENGTLDHSQQSQTFENTADLKEAIHQEEYDLNVDLEQLERARRALGHAPIEQSAATPQPAPAPVSVASLQSTQTVTANNGPANPYKQTILPRRKNHGAVDAAKYATPIGNTADKINTNTAPRTVHREVKIEEYKDKVFLGDSDRIWAAMQSQDRSILDKQKKVANQSSEPKTKTVEVKENTKTIEVSTKSKTQEIPTIDWDD